MLLEVAACQELVWLVCIFMTNQASETISPDCCHFHTDRSLLKPKYLFTDTYVPLQSTSGLRIILVHLTQFLQLCAGLCLAGADTVQQIPTTMIKNASEYQRDTTRCSEEIGQVEGLAALHPGNLLLWRGSLFTVFDKGTRIFKICPNCNRLKHSWPFNCLTASASRPLISFYPAGLHYSPTLKVSLQFQSSGCPLQISL